MRLEVEHVVLGRVRGQIPGVVIGISHHVRPDSLPEPCKGAQPRKTIVGCVPGNEPPSTVIRLRKREPRRSCTFRDVNGIELVIDVPDRRLRIRVHRRCAARAEHCARHHPRVLHARDKRMYSRQNAGRSKRRFRFVGLTVLRHDGDELKRLGIERHRSDAGVGKRAFARLAKERDVAEAEIVLTCFVERCCNEREA